jgi:hypothetical protein
MIVLRDSFSNIVAVPNVLGNDDADIVMIGKNGTLYITQIDATESDQGLYYIYYERTIVGQYKLFIRLREERAGVDPIMI